MAKGIFDFRIIGARDIAGRFARVSGDMQSIQRNEMRHLGRGLIKVLRQEAPIRTGRLRKGLRFKTNVARRSILLHFTSEAPYTKHVIYGRGPVVAINARALRFEPGPPGSGFIFRKRVGPAKANPFVERAMKKAKPMPKESARRMVAKVEETFRRPG